jgi:hypothetical protein
MEREAKAEQNQKQKRSPVSHTNQKREKIMSKGQDSKKRDAKKPGKTTKEKKQAKKDKKEKKENPGIPFAEARTQ